MKWTEEDKALAYSEGWQLSNGAFSLRFNGPFYTILGVLIHLEQKAPDSDLHYRAFMEPRWMGAYNELAVRKNYAWALDGGSWIRGRYGPYQTQDKLFEVIQATADQGCLLSQKALKVLSARKLKGW
jgi:nuclear transport factor 2 (NTF2) superfamily protein